MTELNQAPGPPAGFPRCPECAYLQSGPTRICTLCAARTIEPIAESHCETCSQALEPGQVCRNRLCTRQERHIERINAIATYSGDLASKIKRLKYEGKSGWARIFGRLVAGWLDDNREPADLDVIVANPTFLAPNDRTTVQHTEEVLREAAREDVWGLWRFEPDLLTLAAALPRAAGGAAVNKELKARTLYENLRLSDRDVVEDSHVLVYDDVCTTGSQLDAVAQFLLEQGAASVEALVLARAPWR